MIASSQPATRLLAAVPLLILLVAGTAGAQQAAGGAASLVSKRAIGATTRIVLSPTFLDRQLAHPRVRVAHERTAARLDSVLAAGEIESMAAVFFRVFKRERELELWVREAGAERFTLVETYPVCAVSGELGPKRREGDRQIPEGFYSIDLFNPRSEYHLSMRVDYPNAVDRARGYRPSLGGDIYIHGGCSTVGCVPVTDDRIEELYLLAAGARTAGQRRIPVHIFPTRLDDDGLRWLADRYGAGFVDYPFWRNLQQGYLAFERTGRVPRIGYHGGRYTVDASRRSTGPLGRPATGPGPVLRLVGPRPGSGLRGGPHVPRAVPDDLTPARPPASVPVDSMTNSGNETLAGGRRWVRR
ncbi:MAG: L,D-transpeptidase family protein [Gemmatimonadota bacterium]